MIKLEDKVLFITGIDTNIGKTYATAWLLNDLSKQDKKVISQKFIQTGCTDTSEDIETHMRLLSKSNYEGELKQLTAPIIMTYPASPHLAASIDNVSINLDEIKNATDTLLSKYGYEHVLLEGAGGIMVPITKDYLTIDYIKDMNYPVSLVTSGRLGSINHTLLSIEAVINRGIKLHSIVYNEYPKLDIIIEEDTKNYLKEYINKHLGETQFIELKEINKQCNMTDKTNYSIYTPFQMMAKGGGSVCNMYCDYCYYIEKENLYRKEANKKLSLNMSDAILEEYVKQYIESQSTPIVSFCWHGGESLIRPISFYRRALEFQKKYAGGRQIENSIQTNGLLVSEDWCNFFVNNNFLVGISLDGTQEQHDMYRKTIGGQGSFSRVMRAIQLFQKYGVDFNVLATVNNFNADYPIEFYNFLKGIGVKYIQFTPIVERVHRDEINDILNHIEPPVLDTDDSKIQFFDDNTTMAPYSVTPRQWGDFIISIYDEWIKNDVGNIFVQLFDSTLANWVGVTPGVCSMAKDCGQAGVMEFNGDVYSCDHFVYERYKLGNIKDIHLSEMMRSERQNKFGKIKSQTLTNECKECEYLFACNGECPKNRFAISRDGEKGQNYLCSGYRRFFSHVAETMDFMKSMIMNDKPPYLVMDWLREKNNKN